MGHMGTTGANLKVSDLTADLSQSRSCQLKAVAVGHMDTTVANMKISRVDC